MNRIPPHWEPDHPAVRAWLDRPATVTERRAAVRDRLGINQPGPRNRRVRLTGAFLCLFLAAGFTEQRFDTAVVLGLVGIGLLLPELWADLGGDR